MPFQFCGKSIAERFEFLIDVQPFANNCAEDNGDKNQQQVVDLEGIADSNQQYAEGQPFENGVTDFGRQSVF